MGFIPNNSIITVPDSTSSSGRFIPDNNNTNIDPSQKEASGPLETSLGAVASGLMKGSEAILNTEQGATNIVGGALTAISGGKIVAPSQIFSDTAKQIEKDRQQYLGNQESLHGKVLENIAQLPALIAMVGSGNSAGLLGKGTLEGYAAQSALQVQPNTQGQDIKTQIGNMAWAGTKGAVFGAVIGKAMKMGPVSGPALAAAYTSGATFLEGGDPNDILAGAITGAGMVTLSNPKILATVLTATKENISNVIQGAKNTFDKLKTEGPLTTGVNIIGQKGTDFYQVVKTTMDATDKIEQIDQSIGQLKNEQQIQMDTIAQDAIEQKNTQQQKSQENKSTTGQALTELEQKQTNIVNRVQSILESKKTELSNSVDDLSNKLNTGIKNVIYGLKRGGLKTVFDNIGNAYESGLNAIGEKFQGTSDKPLTRADLIDAHTAALVEIADTNGNIPGGSPVTSELNKNIEFLKNMSLNPVGQERWQQLREMGVSEKDIAQQRAAANAKIDLSEPVPFKMAKGLFDRAKYADAYGSHEGDIVRQRFGQLIEKKLSENGQDTTQFQKMMGDMSDAISAKKVLARMFGLKEGIYSPATSGYKFLEDIARGQGEAMTDGSSMPKLIDVLEKGLVIGGNKAEGLGDLVSNLKTMGDNLNTLEKQYKSIGAKEKLTISNIGKNFVDRISQAKADGKLTQDRIDLEYKRVMQLLSDSKDQLTQNVSTQMEQLKGNRVAQQELLQRKADIGNTINAMGVGMGAYVYKVGAIIRLMGRLTARKQTGFGKKP